MTQDSDVRFSDTIITLIMELGLKLENKTMEAKKVVVSIDYRVSPPSVKVGNENSVPEAHRTDVLQCKTNSVLCGIVPETKHVSGYYIKGM